MNNKLWQTKWHFLPGHIGDFLWRLTACNFFFAAFANSDKSKLLSAISGMIKFCPVLWSAEWNKTAIIIACLCWFSHKQCWQKPDNIQSRINLNQNLPGFLPHRKCANRSVSSNWHSFSLSARSVWPSVLKVKKKTIVFAVIPIAWDKVIAI